MQVATYFWTQTTCKVLVEFSDGLPHKLWKQYQWFTQWGSDVKLLHDAGYLVRWNGKSLCYKSFVSKSDHGLYRWETQEWVNVGVVFNSRYIWIITNKNYGVLYQLWLPRVLLPVLWPQKNSQHVNEPVLIVCKGAMYRITINGNTCYIKWNIHCDMLLVLMIISVLESGVFMPALST